MGSVVRASWAGKALSLGGPRARGGSLQGIAGHWPGCRRCHPTCRGPPAASWPKGSPPLPPFSLQRGAVTVSISGTPGKPQTGVMQTKCQSLQRQVVGVRGDFPLHLLEHLSPQRGDTDSSETHPRVGLCADAASTQVFPSSLPTQQCGVWTCS